MTAVDGSGYGDEEYEVVNLDEPSMEDYPPQREETATHNADGTQKFDAFGAPIRPAVKVRDGVRDRPARPPR